MATVAVLDTILRARTDKFNSKFKKSGGVVGIFKSNFVAASVSVVAASAAMAAKIVADFARAGDAIDKASQRTQTSVADFQSLTFAFEQSGGSASGVEQAIRGLNRNILDLQRGTQTAKDNFADLSLSMKDFEGLNVADRFRLAAERLKSIGDESLKSGLAMKLFGRSGTELLPLLENSKQLEDQFKALGIAFTEDQVSKAAQLTDTWNIMTKSIAKLGAELGETLFPLFSFGSKLIGSLARGAAWLADKLGSVVGFFTDPIFQAGSALLDFFSGGALSAPKASKGKNGAATIITKKLDEGFKTQADLQEKNIREIEKSAKSQLDLPRILEKGQADTISFLNKLGTANVQKRMATSLDRLVNFTEESNGFLKKLSEKKAKPIIAARVPV